VGVLFRLRQKLAKLRGWIGVRNSIHVKEYDGVI